MIWDVYLLNGAYHIVDEGTPGPDGATLIGSTSDPSYLANINAGEPERTISKLAFRRRFTLAERVAFDDAPNNTAFPAEVRATLRTMVKDLELAEEIHLDDTDVVNGLNLLVSLGILTAARADEVRA